MSRLHLLMLLAVGACTLPAAAAVYKWTDADGRVHYSDSPPSDRKAAQVKIKVNSISGPAVVSALKGGPPAAKERVRIYTTTWCGYCKKAKAQLAARQVAFDEIDVEASDSGRREFASLGGRGVPMILVGSQRMDGYDAGRLDAMLQSAGY
ncbi:MAG TPA: glutaredoxin family protein [Burkholderiales bacterium]|jgi:glutaredoxin